MILVVLQDALLKIIIALATSLTHGTHSLAKLFPLLIISSFPSFMSTPIDVPAS